MEVNTPPNVTSPEEGFMFAKIYKRSVGTTAGELTKGIESPGKMLGDVKVRVFSGLKSGMVWESGSQSLNSETSYDS